AVLLSRSTRDAGPLHQVGEQLDFLIKAKEFVLRNKIPGKRDGSQ
ncbi:MAG: TetR/AcrR family transcriptional regulator, partial [Mycobacterium sp.]